MSRDNIVFISFIFLSRLSYGHVVSWMLQKKCLERVFWAVLSVLPGLRVALFRSTRALPLCLDVLAEYLQISIDCS